MKACFPKVVSVRLLDLFGNVVVATGGGWAGGSTFSWLRGAGWKSRVESVRLAFGVGVAALWPGGRRIPPCVDEGCTRRRQHEKGKRL